MYEAVSSRQLKEETLQLIHITTLSVFYLSLFSVQSAIEMYTINGAYAMRHEDMVGSLRVGKLADLVVIDTDIVSGESSMNNMINETWVIQTLLGGREIYRDDFLWSFLEEEEGEEK